MRSLTAKQRLFVDYYLGESHGNASDAARRAGYGKGAGQRGAELVKNSKIRAAIESRLAESALTSKEILARLSEIATADFGEFLVLHERPDGKTPKWGLDVPKVKRHGRLIRRFKFGRYGPEIEMLDPLNALEKLGRYRGLWVAEQQTSQGSINQARERLNARRRSRSATAADKPSGEDR